MDWPEDPDIRRWFDWATGLIGRYEWDRRRAALKEFNRELERRALGKAPVDLQVSVVPPDRSGWYVYQCDLYLRQPRRYDMPQAARILPLIQRLGSGLDVLTRIPGANDRMARALAAQSDEIDSVLFELAVALAYAQRGWRSRSSLSALECGPPIFVPSETPKTRLLSASESVRFLTMRGGNAKHGGVCPNPFDTDLCRNDSALCWITHFTCRSLS